MPPPSLAPLLPGAQVIGELYGYVETWSVPSNDPVAVDGYLAVLGDYLSNISHSRVWNISIEANTPKQFKERNAALRINTRRELMHDHETTVDCGLEYRNATDVNATLSTRPNQLIRLRMTLAHNVSGPVLTELFTTLDDHLLSTLKPFGMVPCRDRSYIYHADQHADPAPSPPMAPPSSSSEMLDVIVLVSAIVVMLIVFAVFCMCCMSLEGYARRSREEERAANAARKPKLETPRVDEKVAQGDKAAPMTGVSRFNTQQPAQLLNKGFSFGGMNLGYNVVSQ